MECPAFPFSGKKCHLFAVLNLLWQKQKQTNKKKTPSALQESNYHLNLRITRFCIQ